MNTVERIFVHLKQKRKTQKELCEHLGIQKQAFSDWKSGKSSSYTKHLPQIANFLDVSIDYLLGKETKKHKHKVLCGTRNIEYVADMMWSKTQPWRTPTPNTL